MSVSFLTGMFLGLSVAAPIGPMGILCMHRTLDQGPRAGIATGLGAATVHFTYGIIVAVGFGTAAATWVHTNSTIWPIVCASALFWLAARLFRAGHSVAVRSEAVRTSLSGSYFSAVMIGAVNPATIVLFAASFPALANDRDPGSMALLASGVFAGSAAWWLAFILAISRFRLHFDTVARQLISKFFALVLAAFGALILLRLSG